MKKKIVIEFRKHDNNSDSDTFYDVEVISGAGGSWQADTIDAALHGALVKNGDSVTEELFADLIKAFKNR